MKILGTNRYTNPPNPHQLTLTRELARTDSSKWNAKIWNLSRISKYFLFFLLIFLLIIPFEGVHDGFNLAQILAFVVLRRIDPAVKYDDPFSVLAIE